MHWGGVAAAALLVAAFSVSGGAASAVEQSGNDVKRFLLFSGLDLWRHGGFAHGGVVWSPAGLDNDGFVFKLAFGGGEYQYRSGALGNATVVGRQLSASLLPGWRFRRGGLIATTYAGLDVQDHRLSPDDPTAGLRGTYLGLRAAIELWYEPSATTMATADASVSTIGPSYSARVAFGWRTFGSFYLGPEVGGFANENYHQARAGLHVTGFKTEPFEWSAGFGWTTDSDDRGGAYGRLGLLTRL